MGTSKFIHIIGPYPPPFGGVSVHIARMIPFLKQSSIPYLIYDQYGTQSDSLHIVPTFKSKLWWILYFFKERPKVVHFHLSSLLVVAYAFFYSLFSKVKIVVSLHNENLLNRSLVYRFFFILIMRISVRNKFVCASQRLSEYLKMKGVVQVFYIPAYVPPVITHYKHVKSTTSPKAFFNAWRLDKNNSEVYGFDLLLELASKFKNFVFYCFVGDEDSGDFVLKSAANCQLSNIECLVSENLVEYLPDADFFLRLNREDSYGVSVKEALDLGVPVIASNVCNRATGAILFENGSLNSLITEIELLVNNNYFFDQSKISKTSYHLELIEMYRALLKD